MSHSRARYRHLFWVVLLAAPAVSQTLNNQSLTGKYFFRHISLGTNAANQLTDARSLLGTITFDGSGGYSFTAQLDLGIGAPVIQSGIGAYSVDPAGFVTLDNPIRTGETVNARYGTEALVGSTTESAGNDFDLFIAIPAPSSPTNLSSLSGGYWNATLEFPGGSFASARNTTFNLNSSGTGTFSNFTVNGHAADLSSGQLLTQPVTGAGYTMASDGTATFSFGTSSNLLNGTKTVYRSKDGNILLGGSTANGSHDLLIGVKAISGATNASWSGGFWGAGLRSDALAVTGYAGSAVSGGAGKLVWTRRLKVLGFGNLDFTGVNSYSLNADGSGTAELAQVAVGASGDAFLGSSVSAEDVNGYEIYFGVRMPTLSGSGVWINPQGVVNPTSFSPTGNPISPGGFIRVYGSGWAQSSMTAIPPYPPALDGVTVLVNNTPAPIYAVTPTTIDFMVPFSTQGPTASLVVQSAGWSSNIVRVPVAATAPGVPSIGQNGIGFAILQHADYTQVTPDHPAVGGEPILIYLTGLGAVTPPIADGTGDTFNPLITTVAQPSVLIGGFPTTVLFSGLTAYPGLYQINVTMPPVPPGVISLPLAIITPNAYHDQVDIPVQP